MNSRMEIVLPSAKKGFTRQVGIDTLDLRSVDRAKWVGCDRAESYAFAESGNVTE